MTKMCVRSLAVAGLLAAAGSAQATFFSFASDTNSQGYTFMGTAGAGPNNSFQIMNDVVNTFLLKVDDNNGPLPFIQIPVKFVSNLVATPVNSAPVSPGNPLWRHSYAVTGEFHFLADDGSNAELLRVDIDSANPSVLTVLGQQNSWSSAGAVLGSDSFGGPSAVKFTATQALVNKLGGNVIAQGYGIALGGGQSSVSSTTPDDFSFDLTVLNAGLPNQLVALNAAHAPTTGWKSEGSYDSSTVLPTPGSATLLGLGGLVALRRRRA
jgi:MYXO-CTERM domain-containing protein